MSAEDSLAVAGRLYTKSLAAALSRAGMLAELARAGVEFRRPVADLGCGDGLFARALREVGLLDGVDVALDYGLESLGALALRPRLGAARGDLTALPFRSGSLGTVLCVTVLSSFEGGTGGVERAVAELHRVLRPGGTAVVVVSTPAFTAEAWPRKALLRLGLRGAAERFARWLDRRNDHFVVRDEDAWVAAFERAGLPVETRRYVLSGRLARRQSWLALVRGGDLPRRLGWDGVARVQGRVQGPLLRLLGAGPLRREDGREEALRRRDARYLLLVARKPAVGTTAVPTVPLEQRRGDVRAESRRRAVGA